MAMFFFLWVYVLKRHTNLRGICPKWDMLVSWMVIYIYTSDIQVGFQVHMQRDAKGKSWNLPFQVMIKWVISRIILPTYIGMVDSHYDDPFMNQSVEWNVIICHLLIFITPPKIKHNSETFEDIFDSNQNFVFFVECSRTLFLLTAECHAKNSRQELGEEENDVIYQSEPWVCMLVRYGYFWKKSSPKFGRLGGGDSNILCVHPEPWGNDAIWRMFFRWVGSTTN